MSIVNFLVCPYCFCVPEEIEEGLYECQSCFFTADSSEFLEATDE